MVPKLRFAGFNEPWSETSLGNISSFITSGSRDWAQYYSDSGDKFIRMTNLVRDGITLNLSDLKFVRLPENSNEGKRTALQHHDILISITAELGKLGWVPDDLGTAYINQHTALVRPNLSITSSKFIANLLSTKKYNNILNQHNDAGAKSGLNLGTIKQFSFYAPNKTEQTKIANSLSSVDEKIALVNRQYELLSQYKKGIMQKIFSQELRFKDNNGREFPKWDMRKFSDYFTIGSSKRVLQDDWVNEGIPFYRTRELVSFSKKEKFKSEIFITEDNYNFLKDKYGIPTIGDFLVSGVGTLGIIHQIKNDNPFYFKDGNVLWFRKNNEISSDFFYQVFNSPKVITQVVDHAAITTVGTYTIENAKKTKFMCPSVDEQTKIANFLSAIDEKITIKKTELDKLKIWKQGLLQQMFV